VRLPLLGFATFNYDAAGNRISKAVITGGNTVTTWYSRDASGNVMSVYVKNDATLNNNQLTQSEVHVYGSSPLGIWQPAINVENPIVPDVVIVPNAGNGYFNNFECGRKLFELSNHLGNVLVTVSDRKFGIEKSNRNKVDYYVADIKSASDYYPFGMQMPGRSYTVNSSFFRYGFNAQEKSNELNSDGNLYTAQFWEYDARIVRRWNLDPKPNISISPYATFENNPIWRSDILGDSSSPGFIGPKQIENQLKNVNGRNVVGTINSVYEKTGGDKLFNQQLGPQQLGTVTTGNSVPDLKNSPSGTEHNEYTNTTSALNVKPNITATNKGWINLIMGHFIKGTGPENWVFPVNGSVSEKMRDAYIVNGALSDWYNWHYLYGKEGDEFHSKSSYDLMAQIDDLGSNFSPFSISNFVGSADVYIKKIDNKTLLVRVENITSVTSGDFSKHLPWNDWPKSLVRDPNNFNPQPYTNISQTFQLTFDMQSIINKYNTLE